MNNALPKTIRAARASKSLACSTRAG